MTVIAKTDRWRPVLQAAQAHMRRLGAHPARCVVLVPYAQLMAEAQRQWAILAPEGFAPRFETTRNWAERLGGFAPEGLDFAHDVARDSFTARALLASAGLGAERDMLAAPLQEAAAQLAPLAAAAEPGQRAAWAEAQRAVVGMAAEGTALRYEAAVARIALEWVAASRHATDVLFEPRVRAQVDAIVALEGFQPDPMACALCAAWGDSALRVPLYGESPAPGHIAPHSAQDAEDEAQRAAACVLAHVAARRVPVALASTDRALVRRISALLAGRNQPVRDENGWTLSTTRAAAQVMASLRACAWNAGADAVLDWAKHTQVEVRALERWLRREALGQWRAATARSDAPEAVAALEALRQPLLGGGSRPLAEWLAALRALLQASGQWPALEADAAGARVLLELHLDVPPAFEAEASRLTLADFTRWVNEVLEAARFKPEWASAETAEVVLLPLPQLLARPFAALVLPGCDEKRLPAAPEPPGLWTTAQRQALGLPTRESLAAAQRAAWANALGTPHVDLLWRASDEGGEPLLASPLVLECLLAQHEETADPRVPRTIAPAPVPRPMPTGELLPVAQLSASAYADLRHCPYRFWALRQLGLQESGELDDAVDKRDFGTWLHEVLQRFHDALRDAPDGDRRALLDTAAREAQQALGLGAADFLPFAAGWPQLRDGYLDWLAKHEATGAAFAQAELRATQPLALEQGELALVGAIDRLDRQQGAPFVIDYKTENTAKTQQRLAAGTEDTQLAFYAALLNEAPLRAAYVNVGERGETKTFEEPDVAALRDDLLAGIQADFDRIAQGHPLPALGEGSVCDWCAARGLCRKDFWKD